MEAYWGSGVVAQRIFDFDTRWRWMGSFTPRPLYPQEEISWFPLDGPQSRSGCGDDEKSIFILTHYLSQSLKWSLTIRFSQWEFVFISCFPHLFYMSRASHLPRFNCRNSTELRLLWTSPQHKILFPSWVISPPLSPNILHVSLSQRLFVSLSIAFVDLISLGVGRSSNSIDKISFQKLVKQLFSWHKYWVLRHRSFCN